MARARIDPRRVKIHHTYDVGEAARLLGIHKNTVRGWLKSGLTAIDDDRPTLILGRHLRAYLDARRKSAKRSCPAGTMYCFKCRAAKPPAAGMVDFIPYTATHGNLRAICGDCESFMHRCARTASIAAVMPGLAVTIQAAQATINEVSPPPLELCLERE